MRTQEDNYRSQCGQTIISNDLLLSEQKQELLLVLPAHMSFGDYKLLVDVLNPKRSGTQGEKIKLLAAYFANLSRPKARPSAKTASSKPPGQKGK